MKKRMIISFISGALIFGTVGAFAGQYVATENPFPIQLNGNNISIEGYNIEGSTYFKLRDIADVIGGFDVGFDNDTILLSNNDYVYKSDETSNATNVNGVVYYADKPWCPDFGAFTGATLIDIRDAEDGTVFYSYDAYTVKNHTDYFDLVLDVTNLTLNPASTPTFILFENLQTNHTISYIESASNGTVIIGVE